MNTLILFTSALLIEIIFSLNGFTLLGLITSLIGDLVYMFVDPRIDFEKRAV